MLVAIYTRVSTREQAQEGYSISEQENTLRMYCQLKEWTVYDVYSDPGLSGSNLDRPAMNRLLFDAQNHRFDAVLVKKLDRMSRSQKDTLHVIEDILAPAGVNFISATENFDTSTPYGKAIIGMLSTFAQLERETIRERTSTGRTERAKAGLFHGGGHIPFGYRFVDSQLIIEEYEAMQIREVYSLFLGGKSVTSIHRHMHAKYGSCSHWKHESSVYNALTLPIYEGIVTFDGKTYAGAHEAIIDQETSQAAKARWHARKVEKLATGTDRKGFRRGYVLSGLLRCANCGAGYFVKGNYSGHGDKKVYRGYYTCYSRGKNSAKMVKDPNCKNKSWAQVVLDKIVIDMVLRLASDPSAIESLSTPAASSSDDTALLRSRLEDVEKQLSRLLDVYQVGLFPLDELASRSQKLAIEQKKLIDMIAEKSTMQKKVTIAEARSILSDAEEVFSTGTLEEQQIYMRSLIDFIELDGEHISIHWKF